MEVIEDWIDSEIKREMASFAYRGLSVEEVAGLVCRSPETVAKYHGGYCKPAWIPTPSEIAERAAEIRQRWTEEERLARIQSPVDVDYEPADSCGTRNDEGKVNTNG
ncbi:hypothetical protein [Rosistilla oblonga]|uniref:hypothetical protein n=1 Tax=Rosistilla oblonga TaxID=2527990 RepID=UPI003A96B7D1